MILRDGGMAWSDPCHTLSLGGYRLYRGAGVEDEATRIVYYDLITPHRRESLDGDSEESIKITESHRILRDILWSPVKSHVSLPTSGA